MTKAIAQLLPKVVSHDLILDRAAHLANAFVPIDFNVEIGMFQEAAFDGCEKTDDLLSLVD